MRPDCVSACIDFGAKHVTYMEIQMDRQMKRQSSGGSQKTFVDHKMHLPRNAIVALALRADRRTDEPTDVRTDLRKDPLIEMRS